VIAPRHLEDDGSPSSPARPQGLLVNSAAPAVDGEFFSGCRRSMPPDPIELR